MLDSLFGAQLGTMAKFAIAFALVLGLIGITALILKRFGGNRMPSSGGGRNRQPRLAVLDSAVVDAKRKLVLIRRDNSEHLLLIGGPSDVVVETNINRAADRRPRGAPPQDLDSLEATLLPEPAYEEPAPQPATRTPAQPAPRMRDREPVPRPQPKPQPEPETYDELPLAPQLRPEPQPEPAAYSPPPPLPPRPAAHPSAHAPAPQVRNEPDYADMQQKMEAALRKPATAPAPRAPEPRVAAQPAPPPRPTPPPMPQTRPMPAAPAPAVAQPAAPRPSTQGAPNPFDSLEAEMASLLGQDKKR
jgi:flagellar protein FliO/FliZ